MSWFSTKNDALGNQEKKLRSQIAEVERQIHQLEKARRKVEKGEAPAPISNPFNDPTSLLKKRPRLFQNPGDQDKYRLGHTPAPQMKPAPAHEEAGSHTAKQPSAKVSPLVPRQDDLSKSLSQFVRESRDDPRAPTEEDSRFLKYLAAGNLEGMKKLQFEKGVARNRKIVLFIFLALIVSTIYLMIKNS